VRRGRSPARGEGSARGRRALRSGRRRLTPRRRGSAARARPRASSATRGQRRSIQDHARAITRRHARTGETWCVSKARPHQASAISSGRFHRSVRGTAAAMTSRGLQGAGDAIGASRLPEPGTLRSVSAMALPGGSATGVLRPS
jgi:hypothetical protein